MKKIISLISLYLFLSLTNNTYAQEYKTIESHKTVSDIVGLLDAKIINFSTLHFKKYSISDREEKLLEEIIYKKHGKFKAIQDNRLNALNDGEYFILDLQTKNLISKRNLDLYKVDFLRSLCIENLYQVRKDYNLKVYEVLVVPKLLCDLYSQNIKPNLYLITGKLKDPSGGPWPPRPKIDIFIDTKLELIVAQRDYWIGVLGSGQSEELAKDNVITKVQKVNDSLYLPLEGKTKGYIRELANLNTHWKIEVINHNGAIDDRKFHIDVKQKVIDEYDSKSPYEKWKEHFNKLNKIND